MYNIDFDRLEEIFHLRQQGLTLKEIGEQYGITRQRVFQILKTGNKDERYARWLRQIEYPELRKWCQDNEIISYGEAAKRFNLCITTTMKVMTGEYTSVNTKLKVAEAVGKPYYQIFGGRKKAA